MAGTLRPDTVAGYAELLGDYNRDDAVDAGDYVVWRKTLNQGVARYSGADGDGDGTVDQDDFNVWRANFGNTLSPGAGSGSVVALGNPGRGVRQSLPASKWYREVTVPLLSSSPKQESKPLLPKSCRCRSSHSSLPGRPLMSSRRSLAQPRRRRRNRSTSRSSAGASKQRVNRFGKQRPCPR